MSQVSPTEKSDWGAEVGGVGIGGGGVELVPSNLEQSTLVGVRKEGISLTLYFIS